MDKLPTHLYRPGDMVLLTVPAEVYSISDKIENPCMVLWVLGNRVTVWDSTLAQSPDSAAHMEIAPLVTEFKVGDVVQTGTGSGLAGVIAVSDTTLVVIRPSECGTDTDTLTVHRQQATRWPLDRLVNLSLKVRMEHFGVWKGQWEVPTLEVK